MEKIMNHLPVGWLYKKSCETYHIFFRYVSQLLFYALDRIWKVTQEPLPGSYFTLIFPAYTEPVATSRVTKSPVSRASMAPLAPMITGIP